MRQPRLVLSDAAVADVLEQSDWYRDHAGEPLALRWERAVTSAITHVLRFPASGSPCSFRSPDLKGVRRTMIPKFPKHLMFYRFEGNEVFVLRIVHGARDLESLFS
jgi:toxin ParE1/3/4